LDHLIDKRKQFGAISSLYNLVKAENTIDKYKWFISAYPDTKEKHDALSKMYVLVKSKNNVSGFRWYINNYTNSNQAKDALISIHKLAYTKAKDINTLESYNDFIIAYPYAEETSDALKKAYKIEDEKYSEWFSSDEKNSRALLIQSKRLSRNMKSSNFKAGYLLVINRMDELLQDKFPAEDATLRYLESEEFKDFVRSFDDSMAEIKSTLKRISENTSNLSSILKKQSLMMDIHFKDAAQEEKMANFYNKQFQDWERYLKPYGIK